MEGLEYEEIKNFFNFTHSKEHSRYYLLPIDKLADFFYNNLKRIDTHTKGAVLSNLKKCMIFDWKMSDRFKYFSLYTLLDKMVVYKVSIKLRHGTEYTAEVDGLFISEELSHLKRMLSESQITKLYVERVGELPSICEKCGGEKVKYTYGWDDQYVGEYCPKCEKKPPR